MIPLNLFGGICVHDWQFLLDSNLNFEVIDKVRVVADGLVTMITVLGFQKASAAAEGAVRDVCFCQSMKSNLDEAA